MENTKGFTLIEILTTISIVGVIFTTAVALFFQTFRAGGKSNSIVDVEQNAQLTMNLLDRFIKNAQSVSEANCPGTGLTSLTLTSEDGLTTTFGLLIDGEGVSRIASNGAAISAPEVNVTNLTFDCVKNEGVPEEIDIAFTVNYTSASEGVATTRTYTTKTGLRTY